jgi:hypothetical protein
MQQKKGLKFLVTLEIAGRVCSKCPDEQNLTTARQAFSKTP